MEKIKSFLLRLKNIAALLPPLFQKYKASWALVPVKRKVALLSVFSVAALLLILAVSKILSRPGVEKIECSVQAPSLPDFNRNEPPSSTQLRLNFSASVAKLSLISYTLGGEAPVLSPAIPGEWKWQDGSILVFTPSQHWQAGTKYEAKLPKELFLKGTVLKTRSFSFTTIPFTAQLNSFAFYQSPVNPDDKRMVATISFSHPVDPAILEENIKLGPDWLNDAVWTEKKAGFTVSYNQYKTEAYIHSSGVVLGEKEIGMKLKIGSGLKSSLGGKGTPDAMESSAKIPSIYSMFQVDDAATSIVRNDKYEPETVITVNFTNGITEEETARNVSAFLLPENCPAGVYGTDEVKKCRWDAEHVSREILAKSQKVTLAPISTDREFAQLHSFHYSAPSGRYVFLKLNKGTLSYGGYRLAGDYETALCVPQYPKELSIMRDGTILSLAGDKKLTIVARGEAAAKFDIGRVVPGQINHIISQSHGSFKWPEFGDNFGPDNISDHFEAERDFAAGEPQKNQYASLGLDEFIKPDAQGVNRGLFFVELKEYDPVRKITGETKDRRFVLVTDLGLLVKNAQDGSHDMFVQSIHSGEPVSGATVEVLGKNGQSIATRQTDERGHAALPSLDTFTREKEPVAYVVKHGADLSFMPYNWEDRALNMSRFDIGGSDEKTGKDALEAYVFSDRGLYRPGDEMRFGLIVKEQNWKRSTAGLPFEAVLTDPRGAEIYSRMIKMGPGGFSELKYTTGEVSPTGTYNLSLYMMSNDRRAQLLGSVPVKVEEFLPDRMKITMQLSQSLPEGWVKPDSLSGLVSVQNLFGVPAQNRKVTGRLIFSPHSPVFKEYPDYLFFDPKQADKSFTEAAGEKMTDDKGNALFAFDLAKMEHASYMLRFQADAFEAEGGRSVGGEASTLVSGLDYLIGYKPDGDLNFIHRGSARSLSIIAVNPQLKMTAAAGLKAQLYEQKYVSSLSRQENGTYKYESLLRELPGKPFALDITKTGYTYKIPTAEAGDFRLSVKDAKGVELSSIKFNVAGAGNITRSLDKNAELQLRLSKTDYANGEDVEFQVKAPYAGTGLITIEREKVYAFKWFKTGQTSSVQKITMPEGVEGNAYLSVSFVRDTGSPEIYMSPLSYATEPLTVSRAKRTNQVTLSVPPLTRPGEPLRIKYKAARPGRIILFAVDEGILQAAAYKMPDPLSYFFRKRALSVRTFQILDLILPEFHIAKTLSAAGGDQDNNAIGKNLNPFKRKRDKPVAYWSGILPCDGTQREVTYTVPGYFNGSLKVMALAVSDSDIGTAATQSTVRGPLVITPNMPLALAPGDEFELSASIANTLPGSGAAAKVSVALQLSPGLRALDGLRRDLVVGENREGTVKFRLKADNNLGSASATLTASIGKEHVSSAQSVSVRPVMPYLVTVKSGHLQNSKASYKNDRVMFAQDRKQEASVSALPLVLANGLMAYLDAVPYVCTEQLVSKAFAALVLSRTPEFGVSAQKAEAATETALKALTARQNMHGAFGMWSDNEIAVPFHTPYAMHFLTEASEAGYPVPREMFNRGLANLKTTVHREPGNMDEARTEAYALYVLARNGIVVTSDLETLRGRLEKSSYGKIWNKDLAGLLMAATYKMLHQDQIAATLLKGFDGDTKAQETGALYDNLVRQSFHLYIVPKHFPDKLADIKESELANMADTVAQERYNTFSSAVAILGFQSLAAARAQTAAHSFVVRQLLPGGKTETLPLRGKIFARTDFSPAAKEVVFENSAAAPMFYQAYTAGFNTAAPVAETANGLEIYKEYRTLTGTATLEAALGDRLEVHIRLRAKGGAVSNVAVVDLLPGGFEVVTEPRSSEIPSPEPAKPQRNEEAADDGEDEAPAEQRPASAQPALSEKSTWQPEYVDIREDRVVAYGAIEGDVEFVYQIQAANRGVFAIPPAFCQSMYDRTVNGINPSGKAISVK